MNGRLDTADHRSTVRFERRLAHPVERVWRAITDPEDLAAWFPGVPRFELEQGAAFVVEGDAGWDLCLERLAAQLAGTPIAARDAMRGWPALHERYAAEFGLDPEVGRRAYAERPATR